MIYFLNFIQEPISVACAHPGMPVDGDDTHKKQKRKRLNKAH